ncbi:MAG TPA: hypothetical protein VHZ30_07320, partial [Verrucomicrobiae bacterium]|nr:hypothetical protein [Verrucomicrobiae bacterium]
MISTVFLQLIEKLTKFAELREKTREKFVDRYVEPMYEDAQTIYQDYSGLLREIRMKIERAKKVGPLLKYLEEKRRVNLPTRTKIRALMNQRVTKKNLTRFEVGVLGLMSGSMTGLDEGHDSFAPLRRGDHTVMDIANRLARQSGADL